jgi:hypothetical protein
MEPQRKILRHFLAALAYRTQKAIRMASDGYADFRVVPGVRTPHQIVRHMSDVLMYACAYYTGESHRALSAPSFAEQVDHFHEVLSELDGYIETGSPVGTTYERLLQGPLADAMSHVGQLALLRRLAGDPVPPENFIEADIEDGRVGREQKPPVSPDNEWLDAEDEPW